MTQETTPVSDPRLDEWEKLAGTYFKIDRINYCLDDVDDLANWAAAAREAIPALIAEVRECHANINLKADFIEATINDSAALSARATAAETRVAVLEQKLREEENTRLKQVGELAGELGRVRALGRAET